MNGVRRMDRCGVGIEETSRWGDEVETKQSLRCVVEWLGGRKEKRRARRGGWLLIRVTRLGVADSVPLRSGQVVGFTRSRRATCKPAVRTDEGSRRVPRSGSVHFSFSFSEKLHTLVFFFCCFRSSNTERRSVMSAQTPAHRR
jgi:hypothetical protein